MRASIIAGIFLGALTVSSAVQAAGDSTTRTERIKQKLYAEEERAMRRERAHEKQQEFYAERRHQRERIRNERLASIARWESVQDKREKTARDQGAQAHLYTVPFWSPESTFTLSGQQGSITAAHTRSVDAFDHDGNRVDRSVLFFGVDKPTVADVLAASRLTAEDNSYLEGHATSENNDYLIYLAHTPLALTARHDSMRYTVTLGKNFLNNAFSCGIEAPFQTEVRSLAIRPELTDHVRSFLRKPTVESSVSSVRRLTKHRFRDIYGNRERVSDFVKDVLRLRGMQFRERIVKRDLVSINCFAHLRINSRYWETGLAGVSLKLPYIPRTDSTQFYPIESENQSVRCALYCSLLKNVTSWLNPSLSCELGYSFARALDRRIPRKYNFLAETTGTRAGSITLGEYISAKKAINTTETHVPQFAQTIKQCTVRPGAEVTVRLGNTSNHCIWPNGSLSLIYQFHFQEAAQFVGEIEEESWDLSWFKKQSNHISHMWGGQFRYQIDSHAHLLCGFTHNFAGRNSAASRTFFGTIQYEF